MLNFKGRYYAGEVIDNMNSIKNTLLNLGVLKNKWFRWAK